MQLTLSRIQLILAGFLICLLVPVVFWLEFLIGGAFTEGKVVDIVQWDMDIHSGYDDSGGYGTASAPVVDFYTGTDWVQFQGAEGAPYKVGEVVQVLYKTNHPEKARIYSVTGFWLSPLPYGLVPFLVLVAIATSALKASDRIRFQVGKGTRFKVEILPKAD